MSEYQCCPMQKKTVTNPLCQRLTREEPSLANETGKFIELVNRHQNIIHKVCSIYAAGAEDKQDLLQEILYQLWRSYPSFQQESQFSTWMYRIALNTAITNFRKAKRKPAHVPINKTLENELRMSDHHSRYEQIEILREVIARLKPIDKAIIMLYLDELSYKEMAEILDLSESNIRVKLNRIKNKLQEWVQQLR